jgi:hypothetical protein
MAFIDGTLRIWIVCATIGVTGGVAWRVARSNDLNQPAALVVAIATGLSTFVILAWLSDRLFRSN